jgi:S-adenosylmethionine synthetase
MGNSVSAGDLYSLTKDITRSLIMRTEKIRNYHNKRVDEIKKRHQPDDERNVKIRYNIEEINKLLEMVEKISKKTREYGFVSKSMANNVVTEAFYTSKSDSRCKIQINFTGTESNGYKPVVEIIGPYEANGDVISEFHSKLNEVCSIVK